MASRDLHAVTLRLDLLRDIMVELAAAQPPDRAEHVLTAVGNRWAQRFSDMALAEPTDEVMVSDLAPVLAALRRSCGRPLDAFTQASARAHESPEPAEIDQPDQTPARSGRVTHPQDEPVDGPAGFVT